VAQRRYSTVTILIIALVMLVLLGGSELKSGADQKQNENIIIVPVQTGPNTHGLAMVDLAGKNLWVYEFNSQAAAHNRLRLLAARSFEYDRLLKDYNTGQPKPEQVKKILEKLSTENKDENIMTDDQQQLDEIMQTE